MKGFTNYKLYSLDNLDIKNVFFWFIGSVIIKRVVPASLVNFLKSSFFRWKIIYTFKTWVQIVVWRDLTKKHVFSLIFVCSLSPRIINYVCLHFWTTCTIFISELLAEKYCFTVKYCVTYWEIVCYLLGNGLHRHYSFVGIFLVWHWNVLDPVIIIIHYLIDYCKLQSLCHV